MAREEITRKWCPNCNYEYERKQGFAKLNKPSSKICIKDDVTKGCKDFISCDEPYYPIFRSIKAGGPLIVKKEIFYGMHCPECNLLLNAKMYTENLVKEK